MNMKTGIFLEAIKDPEKFNGRFRVRIIKAGLSANGNFYSDNLLREAASAFNGARVFVKSDAEHLRGHGKDVRNLIGRIVEVSFAKGNTQDAGELDGTLELVEPESPIAQKLKEALSRGMSDLFGFSIDATGSVHQGRIGGKPARIATKIGEVKSVDLIVEPGAGGQLLNLIESKESKPMDGELSADDVKRIVEATKLPRRAKDKLISANAAPSKVTEKELREAITEEAEYLGAISESGKVKGLGDDLDQPDRSRVRIIEGRDEKASKMLDAFFDPQDRSVVSIRECYLELTGDRGFTGMVRNCDQARLREALGSASFAEVLGDSITRRVIADYKLDTIYDVWRQLATVVPVNDFRNQERARFGGYGDIPVVAESNPYPALGSPTDEVAQYAVQKRGGTEDLTLEMITNDDVGAVQRIPQKLIRAAKRTLSKFVLDFLKTNPVIYDGVVLFHADHGNLGTAAMDAASFAAGRLAMKEQTEKNSLEKLGIGPRFMWVPDALEETAVNLFRRNTQNDKTFLQSLTVDVIPVWYWTDTNDWCLTADPLDIPTMELGFLGGREEPEIFIQDSPTVGSMFTHDKLTYKIRHIYGGAITDYRGAYKAVVA